MAKLLITLRARPSINPATYKRGDVVCVVPASHDWGRKSVLPEFLRMEFLGIAEDHPRLVEWAGEDLIQDGYEDPDPVTGIGTEPRMVHRRRRRFRLLFDNVPNAVKQLALLRDDGGLIDANTAHITIGGGGDYSWPQIRSYIHDKVEDLTEEQAGTDL